MSNLPLSKAAAEGAKKLKNRIQRMEVLHRRTGSLKSAWGLALRYTQLYILTGDEGSLHTAAHMAQGIFVIHFHFMRAYFLWIYLELEQGHVPKAQAMLERLKPYKHNIKAAPELYGPYQFCLAAMELKRGKARPARRQINQLETYNNNADDPAIDALLCGFAIMARERETAAEYMSYTVKSLAKPGAESKHGLALLNAFSYQLLARENYAGDRAKDVLPGFLRWGMAAGVDLRTVMERNKAFVLLAAQEDLALGKALYALHPFDWLLIGCCMDMIDNADYSADAYKYYREAEARQIDLEGLTDALVTAALKNKIEDVSRYSLERYLEKNSPLTGPEGLFVYYLLLKRNAAKPNPVYKNDIIRLGLHALESGAEGGAGAAPYMPLVCKFLIEELEDSARYAPYLDKARRIAGESVFTHEVTAVNGVKTGARYAWVFEDEKEKARIYELEGDKALVTASSPDFSVFLFDDSMKNLPEADIMVVSKLPDAGDAFLFKLREKGYETPEMLIALARYCTGLKGLTPDAVELLNKTLKLGISSRFRTRLSAALGNHFTAKGEFLAACGAFSQADENLLDTRSVENKLLAHVNAGKLAEAAAIVSKRGALISDKALFYSLKRIAAERARHKTIAPAAYELTYRTWYDKQLAGIALEHAQASARDWQEFSRGLANLNAPSDSLDETILGNAIWMHRFDPGAQKVFLQFFERSPLNPYIMAFALYASYEAIVNGAKPEYETIEVMEKLALGPLYETAEKDEAGQDAARGRDARFVYYGLCHVYANHSITTFHSEEIFRRAMILCETDGFIFPIFKDIKDKALLTPYIEKNQPFIYKAGNGKRVFLHYSVNDGGAPAGTGEHVKKQARYVRFGIYAACVPVFFGEKLSYHFSEEAATGSIETKEAQAENNLIHLVENSADLYYIINNAIIYESMFKYEAVEEIITNRLKEAPRVKAWLV